MPRESIADAAIRLLRTHHTRTTAQIADDVAERGISRAADPAASVTRQLRWDPRFHHLDDDRWMLLETLLTIPATHRLTPQEVASNSLAVGADLAHLPAVQPFALMLPTGARFQVLRGDVARLATAVDTGLAIRGPAGWLGGPAGTLVRITAPDHVLQVGLAPPLAPSAGMRVRRLVEATRRRLDAATPGLFGEPIIAIGEVLVELLADEPDFFDEPLPPFGDLFDDTGLEVHHGFIGRAGRDWSRLDAFVERSRASRDTEDDEDHDDLDQLDGAFDDDSDHVPGFDDATLAALAAGLDLDAEETKTLGLVLDLYVIWRVPTADGTRPTDSPTMRRNVAELVGLERVALALAEYVWTDPGFEAFVADLRTGAPRGRPAAGPEFLLGACAEARAAIEEGEQHYRAALAADPDFFPARIPLHRNEIDRGNYAAALAHLRALGMKPGDPWRVWLESLVRPAFERIGRNDPCPCGSGRKFKACHIDRPTPGAAPELADALFRKLSLWIEQPNVQGALGELVHEVIGEPHSATAGGGVPHSREAAAAEDLLLGERSPMTVDVLLFDRGWFDRFLEARGPLLPAAERSLAEAWRSTRRSLYEVQSVRPGVSVTLRDIVADDAPVEVADRSLSRTSQPLDLVFLRLRPDAVGRLLTTDGILVPRARRAYVADLVRSNDAVGQLRWIAFPAPAPRMQNMEGEPILLVTAAYRLSDPAAAGHALARTLRDDGDGVYTETVVRRGGDWTRGTIRIDGDTATVDANSAKRADRLVRLLLKAAPGSRLIKREERGVEEALAEHRQQAATGEGDGAASAGFLDPAEHPEVGAVLDEVMRDFERRWVDERIPALGGKTPREALRDPAGRREVLAVLDDMAWQRRRDGKRAGGGAGMDPDRIRALLGLPEV